MFEYLMDLETITGKIVSPPSPKALVKAVKGWEFSGSESKVVQGGNI